MADAVQLYRLEEINKHNGRESCWIVIEGKVYDVTKYIDQHPGGDEAILDDAGTNATQDFIDVGHSSDAKEILETLFIGYLHPDDEEKNDSLSWLRIAAFASVPVILASTLILAFVLLGRKK